MSAKKRERTLNIAINEELIPSYSLIESLIEPEILLNDKVLSNPLSQSPKCKFSEQINDKHLIEFHYFEKVLEQAKETLQLSSKSSLVRDFPGDECDFRRI